jgi:hypothetical protein
MFLGKKWWIIVILIAFASLAAYQLIPQSELEKELDRRLEAIDVEEPADLVFEPQRVLTITINRHYYPVDQFAVWDSPYTGCSRPHYRAKGGRLEVFGFKNEYSQTPRILTDVGDSGCGFGMYDNFEREYRTMSVEQYKIYLQSIENRN